MNKISKMKNQHGEGNTHQNTGIRGMPETNLNSNKEIEISLK